MEKETVEGLHLGTTLVLLAATLTVGILIFWYARLYSGRYFDNAAAQNQQINTLELASISTSGIIDIPLASVYTILSREWRAVYEVSVFDKTGTLITTGRVNGQTWQLSESLTKADGSAITELAAPEQILYANADGDYSNRIGGRAFITITQDATTKAYSVQVQLQQ